MFYFTGSSAQKIIFSIKDVFSKCDQIRRKLRIWSHLLKKSLTENFILWEVIEHEYLLYSSTLLLIVVYFYF